MLRYVHARYQVGAIHHVVHPRGEKRDFIYFKIFLKYKGVRGSTWEYYGSTREYEGVRGSTKGVRESTREHEEVRGSTEYGKHRSLAFFPLRPLLLSLTFFSFRSLSSLSLYSNGYKNVDENKNRRKKMLM